MTKKILWIALIVLCTFSLKVRAEDTKSSVTPIQKYIAKASDYVQRKDFKGALAEYEEALKIEPNNAKVNLMAGLASANAGNYDQAIKYNQKSVEIEPTFTAYNNLALIYANRGFYQQSIDAYQKALALNPQSFRAWYQLGLVQSANVKFEDAVKSFQKAVEINPQFTDAYLGLGSSYFWSGHKEKAYDQVALLRKSGNVSKASELEKWLEMKDSKKEEAPTTPAKTK